MAANSEVFGSLWRFMGVPVNSGVPANIGMADPSTDRDSPVDRRRLGLRQGRQPTGGRYPAMLRRRATLLHSRRSVETHVAIVETPGAPARREGSGWKTRPGAASTLCAGAPRSEEHTSELQS